LGYLVLACLANDTVLLNFFTQAPIHPPLALHELHTQAWMTHALLTDPGQLPHLNYFYPTPYTIALSEPRILQALLGMPAYLLSGGFIAAFNLAFLLSGPLTCLAAFLMCRAAIGRVAPSFMGGLMLGFAPFTVTHLDQSVLRFAMFVPLGLAAAWALARCPSLKTALLLGLCGGLQLMSCAQYACYLAYGAAGVFVASLAIHGNLRRAAAWAHGLAAAAVGLLASAWILIPFWRGLDIAVPFDDGWQHLSRGSSDMITLLLPPLRLSPISDHSLHIYTRIDNPGWTLFPGLFVLGLSLLWAVHLAHKECPDLGRRDAVAFLLWCGSLWGALMLVGLIPKPYDSNGMLLLGTALTATVAALWILAGRRLRCLAFPAAFWRAASPLERLTTVGIFLVFLLALGPVMHLLGAPLGFGPAALAYLLPGYNLSQAPFRVWILAVAVFPLLAARGYGVLTCRLSRFQSAMVAILLCWGLLATQPQVGVCSIQEEVRARSHSKVDLDRRQIPEIYAWVATLPGRPPLLSLPVYPEQIDDLNATREANAMEALYMYFSTSHWQPLVGGVATYVPEIYPHKMKRDYSLSFPDNKSLSFYEDLGVKYALFHEHFYKPLQWQAMKRRIARFPDRLKLARQQGGVSAYELVRSTR